MLNMDIANSQSYHSSLSNQTEKMGQPSHIIVIFRIVQAISYKSF